MSVWAVFCLMRWLTTDFEYNTGSCHLPKFSDDSAVVGCISEGQEEEYRALIDNFVEWTEQNHLRLNINKTREMVIDFRRKRKRKTAPQPLCILEKDVEAVEDYKYLGVNINRRLDKKGMCRLYFLRKLRSFNVCSKLLSIMDNPLHPLQLTLVRQQSTEVSGLQHILALIQLKFNLLLLM